jgi:dynein heavy chain
MIEEFAKKKKKILNSVSMGEGQEIEAHAHNTTGFLTGSWTLLMNCHLGLG